MTRRNHSRAQKAILWTLEAELAAELAELEADHRLACSALLSSALLCSARGRGSATPCCPTACAACVACAACAQLVQLTSRLVQTKDDQHSSGPLGVARLHPPPAACRLPQQIRKVRARNSSSFVSQTDRQTDRQHASINLSFLIRLAYHIVGTRTAAATSHH